MMDGKVQLWICPDWPGGGAVTYDSLDDAVIAVRALYGKDCDVGNLTGTIMDDEGQVVAEYSELRTPVAYDI